MGFGFAWEPEIAFRLIVVKINRFDHDIEKEGIIIAYERTSHPSNGKSLN